MTDLLAQANNKENRERFLNRLAKQAGRPRHAVKPLEPVNDLPHQVLADQEGDALLATAKTNSESVAAQVVVKPAAALAAVLDGYLKDTGAKQLMLPGVSAEQWAKFGLADWAQHPAVERVVTWSSDPADRRQNAENANGADVAVGFADYLIAATGTITVPTSPAQGRAFNYLPERYLAIVPQSGLGRSPRQAVEKYEAAYQDGLASSALNFISGPSNSGDIEMELVVGVHGPVECTYLIVSDR